MHLEPPQEASGSHLDAFGSIWVASARHLGVIWMHLEPPLEASGNHRARGGQVKIFNASSGTQFPPAPPHHKP